MKMSLSKKLYGSAGVMILALMIVSVLSALGQRSLIKGYKSLSDDDGAQMQASMESVNRLGQAVQAFKSFTIRGDDKYAKEFREHVQVMGDKIEIFHKLVKDDVERNLYENAKAAFDAYEHGIDALIEARKKSRDILAIDKSVGVGVDMRLRIALEDMNDQAKKNYEDKSAKLAITASRLNFFQAGLAIAAVIAGLVLSTLIIRGILRSVAAVKTAAESASRGDLSQEISIGTADEIAEMARSFNQMTMNLRRVVGEINTATNALASSSEELSATSDD
ncbi:MAG TPA: methyl-accepting chemotaxis protein, partial [Nitrospirota bacterium]|nr:methyl-accepting chemotaxis protein [Nitrospirota bacterium]